jgi:hypothetical protein
MTIKRTALRLTPEVQKRIVVALRAGNYVETAASFAGISRPTIYRWLEKGDRAADKLDTDQELTEKELLYLDFRNEVEQARADAMVRNVSMISQAAQTTWQAAAWWLERTAPQMWGRQLRAEVSGPNNGPINVNVSSDDLEALVQSILRAEDKDEEEVETVVEITEEIINEN